MSKSIKISPKHGVNPTIPICFWCGKEKNELALLGRLPGDKEAPMHAVINYEPCDECKERMANGIACIEATNVPIYGNIPAIGGAYPTGNWCVVKPDALDEAIHDAQILEQIKKAKKCFMDPETFHQMFPYCGDTSPEGPGNEA